jgi:hypothetical protein
MAVGAEESVGWRGVATVGRLEMAMALLAGPPEGEAAWCLGWQESFRMRSRRWTLTGCRFGTCGRRPSLKLRDRFACDGS